MQMLLDVIGVFEGLLLGNSGCHQGLRREGIDFL